MPPFSSENEAAEWVHSSRLEIPLQRLSKRDVDAFLEFVFSDVALKPAQLSRRDGAAAVGFLQRLAVEVTDAERPRLILQIHQLWRTLLHAPMPSGSKDRTLSFLERHEQTYLANLDVDWLRTVIERTDPAEASKPAPPPLMSRRMSGLGAGNPHLLDDLSERIHGAYRALVQSGIRSARRLTAGVLEAKKLYSSAQHGPRLPWNSDAVSVRVKQYEKRLQAGDSPEVTTKEALARRRQQAASKWIYLFRTSNVFEGSSEQAD